MNNKKTIAVAVLMILAALAVVLGRTVFNNDFINSFSDSYYDIENSTTVSVSYSEEEPKPETDPEPKAEPEPVAVSYHFRNSKLLNQHYEKHGIDMGFDSAASYEAQASAVINNPEALSKTEAEDGDYVYYVEATNEFVVLSLDGYIRTYFFPDSGKSYYDRQ